MYTAKDIMTAKVRTLESSNTIEEAIQLFNEAKVSSVPVTNGAGQSMGMMTEMSLVRAVVLIQLQPDKFKKIAHIHDLLEKVVFVHEADPMPKILAAMISSPAKRVIVQNNAGNFIGIISPKDLLKALNGDKSLAQSNQKEVAKPAAADSKPSETKSEEKKSA